MTTPLTPAQERSARELLGFCKWDGCRGRCVNCLLTAALATIDELRRLADAQERTEPMPDPLSPALAKLIAEQYQSPNGDGLGHRYEPDTIVATLRAVAATLTNVSALTLDNRQVSIPAVVSDWADEIGKGGTP